MKNECNVEVFSRVTGFYRPVKAWNPGKVEEFDDRITYGVNHEKEEEVK